MTDEIATPQHVVRKRQAKAYHEESAKEPAKVVEEWIELRKHGKKTKVSMRQRTSSGLLHSVYLGNMNDAATQEFVKQAQAKGQKIVKVS